MAQAPKTFAFLSVMAVGLVSLKSIRSLRAQVIRAVERACRRTQVGAQRQLVRAGGLQVYIA